MSGRPKCSTCVNWQLFSRTRGGMGMQGHCLRLPPKLVNPADGPEENWAAWSQPVTFEEDACAEHQDFPAYLAWFRSQPQRDAAQEKSSPAT